MVSVGSKCGSLLAGRPRLFAAEGKIQVNCGKVRFGRGKGAVEGGCASGITSHLTTV